MSDLCPEHDQHIKNTSWRLYETRPEQYRSVTLKNSNYFPTKPNGDGITEPILAAQNLVKRYGGVTALDNCNFELMPDEIIAVIGDNGAGKSTLIKVISGALVPDFGEIFLEGQRVNFSPPLEARERGIETVYQTMAMSPALSIADNMFMGREIRKSGLMGRVFRQLDKQKMQRIARDKLSELGLMTIQDINQAVETLSGGQRQGDLGAGSGLWLKSYHS